MHAWRGAVLPLVLPVVHLPGARPRWLGPRGTIGPAIKGHTSTAVLAACSSEMTERASAYPLSWKNCRSAAPSAGILRRNDDQPG